MRKIVCECEVCGKEKVFLPGESEYGFCTLKVDSVCEIYLCDDCEVKVCTSDKVVKRSIKNSILTKLKDIK